jgi:hypothetical protein
MQRLLIFLTAWATILCGADLSTVHSVYLMPMGSGLDQFLAERLTSEHVFQVVTDPKLADAVLTDRIGKAFEENLADLTAPPPPPKSAEKAGEKQAADKPAVGSPAGATSDQTTPTQSSSSSLVSGFGGDTENKLSDPAANSSFGRGKGTIFLVNVKSKQVIWSVYEQPKGSGSVQLDHSALDIVSRLKRDLKKPEGSKP